MAGDQENTAKEVEDELAEIAKRSEALEKQIENAEAKHAPPPDHAGDGGVI